MVLSFKYANLIKQEVSKEWITECEVLVDSVTLLFNNLFAVISDLVDFYIGDHPQVVAVAVLLKV